MVTPHRSSSTNVKLLVTNDLAIIMSRIEGVKRSQYLILSIFEPNVKLSIAVKVVKIRN